jgi:cellobiose phosphorylase
MLYGFLGFRPTADGCAIHPRLPADWPKLTITRIHLHQHVLDITADASARTISIAGSGPKDDAIAIDAPTGWKVVGGDGLSVKLSAN